jgi:hypothetical protein
MPRKIRLLLIGLATVLVLGLVCLLVFSVGQPPVRPPLPYPNGYNDFLQAGPLVTGKVSDYPTLNPDDLRAVVSTNAEALRLLRLGLTRQCLMPLDGGLTNASGVISQLADMKHLAQLLAAEGRLMEFDNRPAEAAHSYLQDIQFGNELSRGGLLITRLVGIACENIGRQGLVRVVPQLSGPEARQVIGKLEKIDATRAPWAETLENENYYIRQQLRGYRNPLMRFVSLWNTRRMVGKAEVRHKMTLAQERLLTTELALRCCQAEGHPLPLRLDDLVTNYLSRLPADPFSAQAVVYRPHGTNWLLYSVGPDGVDDGGKPAQRGGWPIKGDLRCDAP